MLFHDASMVALLWVNVKRLLRMYNGRVIFACAVTSVETEAQACLLTESIRANGGRFAQTSVWVLVADDVYRLSPKAHTAFEALGVETIPFDIASAARGFPFAGKVSASAAAERLAQGKDNLLVWLDPDSIVFREPAVLQLTSEKTLACRPVDHILIGSPYDEPPNDFWREVYLACDVPAERLFPMTTSADEKTIRPYFNAGMLVVRPGAGMLRQWRDKFLDVLVADILEPFFAQDILYRIFLHQAILAGVILSTLTEQQIEILPHIVNYPLHMHAQYPASRRPDKMNDLISGRYDTFFEDPAWAGQIPSVEPLTGWLAGRLATYGVTG